MQNRWTVTTLDATVDAEIRRVVILRAFVKKTQKTSNSEIRLALERARQLQR